MKSLLLFAFMNILANFMWCGRNENEPTLEYGPLQGEWNITSIEKTDFDANMNTLGSRSIAYNAGDKLISFEEGSNVYKEFEKGNLVKSGTYEEHADKRTLLVITGQDTIFYNRTFILKNYLELQTDENKGGRRAMTIINATR